MDDGQGLDANWVVGRMELGEEDKGMEWRQEAPPWVSGWTKGLKACAERK